jgi:glycine cleavage system H protein
VSDIPAELRYSTEHEYVRRLAAGSDTVEIGITDYAQGELGDVVFVELPQPGAEYDQGAVCGTIEAVKAVSELFCPVSGTVTEINPALEGDPGMVNREPYGKGWMLRLKLSKPEELDGLLDAAAYRGQIGQ